MTKMSPRIWSLFLIPAIAGFGVAFAGDEVSPKSPNGAVKLEKLKFDEFRKVVANKKAKYTVVDVWATWCGPCKKNFPHLVELHKKLADRGLAVVSLSFDDPTKPKQVAEAEEFLREKQAAFRNILLDEEEGVGFEKLDITSIPAVFLFDSNGKEIKRFTLDDPDHQFTYEQVEKEVVALLDAKPADSGKSKSAGK